MRRLFAIVSLITLAGVLAGCNDDEAVVGPAYVPPPPQGVFSVTGDGAVYIYWNGVYDNRISEYIVNRSDFPDTGYYEIGRVRAEADAEGTLWPYEYVDTDVTNGDTYYYAVSSVSTDGRESKLSAEEVHDTPRPEGIDVMSPNNIAAATSGFDFETGTVVYDTSQAADIFVDVFDGIYYLNVADAGTDIMDMGYTADFDSVSISPSIDTLVGWSELPFVELVIGHTYVIWTWDNHFAKVRPYQLLSNGSVRFEWAWQGDEGNPQLVPALKSVARPEHDSKYLARLRNRHAQE